MPETATWSLPVSVGLFLTAVVLIAFFGVMMTIAAEKLARQTGLGEAVMGTVFIGAATSLPEVATSITAALEAHAELAVSNAVGSIAGQTAFLAIADMAYRKVNLEHAAASAANLILGAFLMTLLAIPLLAMSMPDIAFFGIHPATPGLFVAYAFGIWLVSQTSKKPMWHPRVTRETRTTEQSRDATKPQRTAALWLRFVLCAFFMATGGWLLGHAGISISIHTGLSETIVGGLFTALSGSAPELITAVTAVRLGALTMAVGDVLGGNAFDTVIIALSDIAYREGSIYVALSSHQLFLLALTVLLTGILLMGMLHREKHGIANIGLESFLIITLYAGAFTYLSWA